MKHNIEPFRSRVRLVSTTESPLDAGVSIPSRPEPLWACFDRETGPFNSRPLDHLRPRVSVLDEFSHIMSAWGKTRPLG